MAAPRIATLYEFFRNQGYLLESKTVSLRIAGEEIDIGTVSVKLGADGVNISVAIESCHTDIIAALREALPEIEVRSYEASDW